MTFGIDAGADVRATDVERPRPRRARARDVRDAGRRRARSTTPLLGRGNLSNVLAATAVALEFDVPLDAIVDARRGAAAGDAPRRAASRLPGGVTLIDDSYNSSPAALKRALETVAPRPGSAAQGRGARRDARARRARRRAARGVRARAAAARASTLLVAVGGAAARARSPTPRVAAGMPADAVAPRRDERRGGRRCARAARAPGDLVLVKGSRGIGTDLVVDRLKAEFA